MKSLKVFCLREKDRKQDLEEVTYKKWLDPRKSKLEFRTGIENKNIGAVDVFPQSFILPKCFSQITESFSKAYEPKTNIQDPRVQLHLTSYYMLNWTQLLK